MSHCYNHEVPLQVPAALLIDSQIEQWILRKYNPDALDPDLRDCSEEEFADALEYEGATLCDNEDLLDILSGLSRATLFSGKIELLDKSEPPMPVDEESFLYLPLPEVDPDADPTTIDRKVCDVLSTSGIPNTYPWRENLVSIMGTEYKIGG